ncbi:norsolorinic acid reductase [Cladorrhinum sp. PSN332]|nr:norsolorinic acid reductase [Cladorrhinum sp. PSN332]
MDKYQSALSTAIPPAPPPKGPLNKYRLLSPTASVRVSPLCLGGMNLGSNWKEMMGEMSQEQGEGMLDCFYDNGGNFIDTANLYQNGQSEQWIGGWMKKRGNRDEMVIATKYTTNFHLGRGDSEIMVNYSGNGSKSLRLSVEASLKNLQTDYIDILFIHWYDHATSIPELMQSLNSFIASHKVLYVGISDSPAWVVSKANQYARDHGLAQFSVYQGQWNAAARDMEREIVPMCRAENMGIMAFGCLGGGMFKTSEQLAQRSADGERVAPPANEKFRKVSLALERVAERKGTTLTAVAMAYVMGKAPYVFPIVGGRKVEYLEGNIEALKISLGEEDVKEIEDSDEFEVGFPGSVVHGGKVPKNPQDAIWLYPSGTCENVPVRGVIVPK